MRFSSTLFQTGNNTGIEVPPEIVEELGGGKRPAVAVVVNGYAYGSSIGVMGGRYLIPFSSEKRAESGIGGGDAIEVELTLDTAPRTVELPEDLSAALQAAGVREAFDGLAPSARKAHVTSVEGARAAETRQRRIESIVATLTA